MLPEAGPDSGNRTEEAAGGLGGPGAQCSQGAGGAQPCGPPSCGKCVKAGGKVAAAVPSRMSAPVCFCPCMRGRVGSWGVGAGLAVFCGWLWQAASRAPTHLLHQASLNGCLCLQPLDLCNPARTLLLSEELLLYEGRNKAAEVRHAPSPGEGPGGPHQSSSRPLHFPSS